MSKLISCPHCKSFKTERTTKGTITRGVATGVGKVTGMVADNLVKAISPIDLSVEGGVSSFVKSAFKIEHECLDCDCLFNVEYDMEDNIIVTNVKKYPVPDDIIDDERTAYVASLQNSMPYASTIISGIATVGLFIYCWINDFTYQVAHDSSWFRSAGTHTHYNISWLFFAFLLVLALIWFFVSWSSIQEKKKEIVQANGLSKIEFKRLHRDLFSKYPEYR
ncbi:MAG: hypothetical protein LUD17_11870 [Bacteroidales bacterium]|nr:hypothetical protein [Bacteroidales bacterium]